MACQSVGLRDSAARSPAVSKMGCIFSRFAGRQDVAVDGVWSTKSLVKDAASDDERVGWNIVGDALKLEVGTAKLVVSSGLVPGGKRDLCETNGVSRVAAKRVS